jgi:hypothetical protein
MTDNDTQREQRRANEDERGKQKMSNKVEAGEAEMFEELCRAQ